MISCRFRGYIDLINTNTKQMLLFLFPRLGLCNSSFPCIQSFLSFEFFHVLNIFFRITMVDFLPKTIALGPSNNRIVFQASLQLDVQMSTLGPMMIIEVSRIHLFQSRCYLCS